MPLNYNSNFSQIEIKTKECLLYSNVLMYVNVTCREVGVDGFFRESVWAIVSGSYLSQGETSEDIISRFDNFRACYVLTQSML